MTGPELSVQADRKSLEEVHGSVAVNQSNPLKRLFAFMGPAYLVSVGYMDPGNWATDIEGGARFGYALIWVLLMSNLIAVLLQTLSARLGVITGHDLAQACRSEYSRPINIILWLLAEIAIAATDLAEVIGTIIALKLLFDVPVLWGCLVTALDTFLLLWLQKWGMRKMEAVILTLVATIGGCFLLQILSARPDPIEMIGGLRPSLPDGALFVAIGILGATVMPHNLYLHSALVQSRRIGSDVKSRAQACKYNLVDSAIALNAAFFVNSAILVLSAAVFHANGVEVASIMQAHQLLPEFLNNVAPLLFGVALLCAGQSSTLTGTLAGQIVMEGYLDIRLAPWLRRLITRLLALVPAVAVVVYYGEGQGMSKRIDEQMIQKLLVLSQVILSLQLSFAVIPLIHFTSNRKNMGAFASPVWVQALAWLSAAIIVSLNAKLVLDSVADWVGLAAEQGALTGLLASVFLYGLISGVGGLLFWVTFKPLIRPSAPWKPLPRVELDWADLLRPRKIETVAIALEHGKTDAETLSRAISFAQPGRTRLVLLHVVDTPMSRVYGEDAADRETDVDQRYLQDIVEVLSRQGFEARSVLLHGPNIADKLVDHLKKDPADLIVIGSHGHGLVRDLLFGQTVDKVRHGLSIPMLVARPGRPPNAEPRSAGEPAETSVKQEE